MPILLNQFSKIPPADWCFLKIPHRIFGTFHPRDLQIDNPVEQSWQHHRNTNRLTFMGSALSSSKQIRFQPKPPARSRGDDASFSIAVQNIKIITHLTPVPSHLLCFVGYMSQCLKSSKCCCCRSSL